MKMSGLFFASPKPSFSSSILGRESKLKEIENEINVNGHNKINLQGIGGIGKTRVALEFAENYEHQFPGGIFWLSAEKDEQRLEQFYNILNHVEKQKLSLDELLKAKEKVPELLAQAIRKNIPSQKNLWILDNFPESPDPLIKDLVNHWHPVAQNAVLLMTCRRAVALSKSILIEPLDPSAAISLLKRNANGPIPSDTDLNAIANWVGYLPLALELINASTIEPEYTLDKWYTYSQNSDISEETEKMMQSMKEIDEPLPLPGVIEVYRKSYDSLSPNAKFLACLLAQFGPEPIPKELTNALDAENTAIRILQRHSFISGDHDGFVGSMHRVLASALRYISKQERQEDAMRSKTRDALLKLMTNESCSDPSLRHLINSYRAHAIAWWENGECKKEEDTTVCSLIGQTFWVQGEYQKTIHYQKQAYQKHSSLFGKDNPDSISLLNNLALSLCDIGEYEKALKYQLELLKGDIKNKFSKITLKNNIGMTYFKQGNYKKAFAYQQAALSQLNQNNSFDPQYQFTVEQNLAQTLIELGQAAQGKYYFINALQSQSTHPQARKLDFFRTLVNYALYFRPLQIPPSEALKYAQEGLNGLKNALPDSHPHVQFAEQLVNMLLQEDLTFQPPVLLPKKPIPSRTQRQTKH